MVVVVKMRHFRFHNAVLVKYEVTQEGCKFVFLDLDKIDCTLTEFRLAIEEFFGVHVYRTEISTKTPAGVYFCEG